MTLRSIIYAIIVLAVCSCVGTPDKATVVRLDQQVARFPQMTPAQRQHVADSLRPELDAYFSVLGIPHPTVDDIDAWARGPVVTMFQPQVDKVYPDLDNLSHTLGAIVSNAAADSLALPTVRFATVVWGKPQPVMRVDSVMLIALNHYLGADFEGYSNIDAYRRADKEPWAIPYDVAAALAATEHPFEMSEPPTLLNWMLYEGALVETRMRLVPEATLTHALGYRPDQLEVLDDNFRKMWDELAVKGLLYDTDLATIDRLLTSAPSSPLLDGKAPGRAGRYIGYMIVKAYLRLHPSTSLGRLLSPEFYGTSQTLIDSDI